MGNMRTTATRVAGGLLLSLALVACESTNPIAAPDGLQEVRVTRADKMAGIQSGQMLGRAPAIPAQSEYYAVDLIPYQPGPSNLPNTGPVCDDCVMNGVPIGFEFEFYETGYNQLQISSNGFLRFAPANNDSGCCSGRPIPVPDLWNNIIAFAWTDLIPTGGLSGTLRYGTVGEPGNRRFILHADSIRIFGQPVGTRNLSQWVVLHEGTNIIEIHTEFFTPGPQLTTQGIENAAGTDAAFVPGRVASTFTLNNDAVRFTPRQIMDVDIENVYSGDPPQDPGVVSLDDEWLYVEIFNVEQYLGRPASPGDVRIGPNWEAGTPAESFQILDINNDGNLDIRLRFSIQALVDNGHLNPQTTQLMIWGQDPVTEELYRGVAEVTVIGGPAFCWDNGPFITHPGAGPGGTHVSMSDPVNNTAGSNVLLITPGPEFRVADDFVIPAGGWTVQQVVTRAYRTGGPPNWTSANLNIRSGSFTGPIVATATTTNWEFTGVYRTFNAVLQDNQRPIYELYFNFPDLNLAAGTYWIDWQVVGGTTAWAPYVTLPDPTPGGFNTQTVFENGRQLTPLGWEPLLAPPGAETPFLVLCDQGGAMLPITPARAPAPESARPLQLPRDYHLQAEDRAH